MAKDSTGENGLWKRKVKLIECKRKWRKNRSRRKDDRRRIQMGGGEG